MRGGTKESGASSSVLPELGRFRSPSSPPSFSSESGRRERPVWTSPAGAFGTERHKEEDGGGGAQTERMVTDVQLAIFANMLGVSLFLLVVLYHYVAVNNPKKQE